MRDITRWVCIRLRSQPRSDAMQDDELAAVIAALNVYSLQAEQPQEPVSAWKLAARREAVTDVR